MPLDLSYDEISPQSQKSQTSLVGTYNDFLNKYSRISNDPWDESFVLASKGDSYFKREMHSEPYSKISLIEPIYPKLPFSKKPVDVIYIIKPMQRPVAYTIEEEGEHTVNDQDINEKDITVTI